MMSRRGGSGATATAAAAGAVVVHRGDLVEREDIVEAAQVIFETEETEEEEECVDVSLRRERTMTSPSAQNLSGMIMRVAADKDVQNSIIRSLNTSGAKIENERPRELSISTLRDENIKLREDLIFQQDLNEDLILFQNRLHTRIEELEFQVKQMKRDREGARVEEEERVAVVETSSSRFTRRSPQADDSRENSRTVSASQHAIISVGAVLIVVVALATKFSPSLRSRVVSLARSFFFSERGSL